MGAGLNKYLLIKDNSVLQRIPGLIAIKCYSMAMANNIGNAMGI